MSERVDGSLLQRQAPQPPVAKVVANEAVRDDQWRLAADSCTRMAKQHQGWASVVHDRRL